MDRGALIMQHNRVYLPSNPLLLLISRPKVEALLDSLRFLGNLTVLRERMSGLVLGTSTVVEASSLSAAPLPEVLVCCIVDVECHR